MTLNFPSNPYVGERYTYGDTIWKWNGVAWDNVSGNAVSYVHAQNVSSNTWYITHNLGFYPNITVVDSGGTIYEGEINYVSNNEVTLTFSAAFSGKAYLS